MTAEELIRELRGRGVELAVEGDRVRYRPKNAVPAELQPILTRYKSELLALLSSTDPEVAWRADRMRSQVPVTGPIPFLVARPALVGEGQCLSCGGPLGEGHIFRCGPCAQAATLILHQVREGTAP